MCRISFRKIENKKNNSITLKIISDNFKKNNFINGSKKVCNSQESTNVDPKLKNGKFYE